MTEQTKYWANTEDNEVLPVLESEDLENTFGTFPEAEGFLVDFHIDRIEHLRETYLNK